MRFGTKRLPCIISVLLVVTLCGSCVYWTPKVWTETSAELFLPADAADALKVETHNGAVTVKAADGVDTITAHVTIRAGGADEADAAQCQAAIELHTPLEGSTRVLTWRWAETKKRSWSAAVAFDIEIPASLAVEIATHNGAVHLEGTRSKTRLATHNGSVTVSNHDGDLSVTTHNGEIRIESSSARFELGTHNGAIESHVTCGGPLNGDVTTHNGSITLSLSDGASAEIVGTTHAGRISVNREIDITVQKKNLIVGRTGAGEGRIEIETHNGSITLN